MLVIASGEARPARARTRPRSYVETSDAFATRGASIVERGRRRSTTNGRAARSARYASVGTTVTVAPKRFARSFDTTTQVRVFFGSAPTDGSQSIHRMSPRRKAIGSLGSGVFFFIPQKLQLGPLEVADQRAGVRSIGPVRLGPVPAPLGLLASGECLAQQSAGMRGEARPF